MKLEEKLKLFKEKGWTYNPETGEIYSHTGNIIKGQANGYICCGINSNKVKGHQLGWYLYYGEVPKIIDHINRIKIDNRISNLREVTHQENSFNQICKGYSFHRLTGKWMSRIKLNGKSIFLGYFNTKFEAHNEYLLVKKELHKI